MSVSPIVPHIYQVDMGSQGRTVESRGCDAQPEAVDAALSLFYSATAAGGGSSSSAGQTFSRSAERKTLMMQYALALALHVESFAMAPEQVRSGLGFKLALAPGLQFGFGSRVSAPGSGYASASKPMAGALRLLVAPLDLRYQGC